MTGQEKLCGVMALGLKTSGHEAQGLGHTVVLLFMKLDTVPRADEIVTAGCEEHRREGS